MVYVSPNLDIFTSVPTDGYFKVDAEILTFNINDYKIVKNEDGTQSLVPMTEEDKIKEENENRKRGIYKEIQEIISEKMNEAKILLAQKYDVPEDQIKRYEAKYEMAKVSKESGDYSVFEFEAKIQGVTPEELAESIIKLGNSWYKTLNTIYTKLDGLRIKLENYLDSKTDEEFKVIFEGVKNLNPVTMTDNELEAI